MNQSEATGSHLLVTEKFGHELLSSLTRPDTDEQKDRVNPQSSNAVIQF